MVGSHGRFVWYELITTDVAAAKAFYTKVIGWGAWDAPPPGSPYTFFTVGGDTVGGLIELTEDERTKNIQPSWLGYVGVNDVDDAAHRIKRLGGAVHVPPTNIADISRFSVFSDPQAARLALLKWLNPGPERAVDPGAPGRIGWHELLAADRETALAFYTELFGWQKADSDTDATGTYQLFSAAGDIIGGMLTKPQAIPAPLWLYYFNVSDIDAAAQRVRTEGGQILAGPVEIPGGSWIVLCIDSQGAKFALEGTRGRKPVGYFKRTASPSKPEQRWSW
ncbi:MAG: VOC family protein [Xanthobacteraceae bacterium]|nr:VOC family protein [Xanthobacteraceae bacterium]